MPKIYDLRQLSQCDELRGVIFKECSVDRILVSPDQHRRILRGEIRIEKDAHQNIIVQDV